jgi:hypothetical protein
VPVSFLNINDVPQAIQLAMGPAFLLTGIAGLLNVMTGRLARIIDRGRRLADIADGDATALSPAVRAELRQLDQRRHLAGVAISACTLAALLVCLVIASLFFEVFLDAHLSGLIGTFFTGATLALVVGLAYFLREVHAATAMLRATTAHWRRP